MAKKMTLLKLLEYKFENKTRDELLACILCGDVRINEEKCLDPKIMVNEDSVPSIEVSRHFVSRGGVKLNTLLNEWHIDVNGKTFIDAGSSAGGFTDCLLKRGACFVYAVDVGFNQLDYSLRTNDRVRVMEKVNIMGTNPGMFPLKPTAAVMDLSFRSVRGAAAHLLGLLEEQWIIALIKPQFEWRNPGHDFDGVIRDPKHYYSILISLVEDLAEESVYVGDAALSALKGGKGNSEFFFLLETEKKTNYRTIERKISSLISDI